MVHTVIVHGSRLIAHQSSVQQEYVPTSGLHDSTGLTGITSRYTYSSTSRYPTAQPLRKVTSENIALVYSRLHLGVLATEIPHH